jgi:predicted molibdopterin-dependent oxidoreductase YjgC
MGSITMDYENILTTCVYCGCGCGLYFEVLDGEIVGVLPAKEHPIGRGSLCIKGWNAASFVNHPERLTTPLVRKGDGLVEATWDEALALVAERLAASRDEHGPDSVGLLASAKCTNEENYLLQKLARVVVKTNNVDHCARL